MQTKLTLRLEEQLIERAKAHAKKRGKSVLKKNTCVGASLPT